MRIFGNITVGYEMSVGTRAILWDEAKWNAIELTLIEGPFCSIDSVKAYFFELKDVDIFDCGEGAYMSLDLMRQNEATVEKYEVRIYEDDRRVLAEIKEALRIEWLDGGRAKDE